MNKRKLNQLFELARRQPAPAPPEDFAADVLRAVRHEPAVDGAEATSMGDRLIRLFPQIVWAAAAVIILCIGLDVGLTAAGMPDLSDGLSRISSQWLLTPDEFL